MHVFSLRIVSRLLLITLVCSLISCNKDDLVEEMTIDPPSIELDKTTLLGKISDPNVINFFDLDFIEQANPHLSGEAIGGELVGAAESVYLDFLIKNGELDYVPDLIPRVGYPMWHRLEVSQGGSSAQSEPVVIPFADLENGKTNALMIAIPSNDDLFYQEHNLDRSGYYYLTMTRQELAAELENLDEATDNTYSFLFHFLSFDELIFDHRNEEWWAIWEDYDGLVREENRISMIASGITFRGGCSVIISRCLPYALVDDTGGEIPDSEVEFRDCNGVYVETTYSWDCPGSSGGYTPGGSIPGTSGTSGNGGSGSGSGTTVNLDQIIADCSSLLSVDAEVNNPQYGEGECAALLAAIENLGYDALPQAIWLALFEHGGALLDEAGTISSETDMVAYNLYLTYTLSRRTSQPFRVFSFNYRRVQELQEILGFDAATFQWLFDEAVSVSAGETSIADEIAAFLENATDSDSDWRIALANIMLADAQAVNLTADLVEQFTSVCIDLQLDIENARWLLSESAVLAELSQHLLSGRFHPDELHYSIWAIRNFGNDLDYYIDKLNEFRGEEPPFVDDIENGISILNSFVPVDAPENYPIFVQTPYRRGHEYSPGAGIIPEDLRSGPDGDPDLLSDSRPNNRALDSKSDTELFDIFEGLITSPWLNQDLTAVAETYKDRFQNSTGGDYFNAELSEYVRTNDHMKVTAKDFGKWLNDRLIETGGDIDAIDPDLLAPEDKFTPQYRAIFDAGEYRSGLKILINDTEKLDVYTMDDFTFNPDNNEWSGTFYFAVYDNFGLDNKDLIDFQGHYDIWTGTGSPLNFGRGFAAWWILQHRRGYVPFRTEIRTAFQLKGDLDN